MPNKLICEYIVVDQHLSIRKLLSSDYTTYKLPHNMAATDRVNASYVYIPWQYM